jgi:hypothetical protein
MGKSSMSGVESAEQVYDRILADFERKGVESREIKRFKRRGEDVEKLVLRSRYGIAILPCSYKVDGKFLTMVKSRKLKGGFEDLRI